MSNRKIDPIELAAKEAILKAFEKLNESEPGSEDHKKILEDITKLNGLLPEKHVRKPLSMDVIFTGLISTLGIGMIVNKEVFDIVNSKALGFVKKV